MAFLFFKVKVLIYKDIMELFSQLHRILYFMKKNYREEQQLHPLQQQIQHHLIRDVNKINKLHVLYSVKNIIN